MYPYNESFRFVILSTPSAHTQVVVHSFTPFFLVIGYMPEFPPLPKQPAPSLPASGLDQLLKIRHFFLG